MKQESLTQRRLPTAPGSSLTRRQERVAPVNSRQHLFKLKVYWVLYSRDCKAHHITPDRPRRPSYGQVHILHIVAFCTNSLT